MFVRNFKMAKKEWIKIAPESAKMLILEFLLEYQKESSTNLLNTGYDLIGRNLLILPYLTVLILPSLSMLTIIESQSNVFPRPVKFPVTKYVDYCKDGIGIFTMASSYNINNLKTIWKKFYLDFAFFFKRAMTAMMVAKTQLPAR